MRYKRKFTSTNYDGVCVMIIKSCVLWTLCLLVLGGVDAGAEESKRSLAVVPFDALGVSEMECEVITERFRAELSRTDRFLVTSKHQTVAKMAKIKDVAELGKQLDVDRILVGSVSKIGTTFSVVGNLIDPLSGKTVKTVVEDHSGGIDGLLQEVIRRASERLADYEGTGYLAFVGPRGGDTINRLTVWLNGRQLHEFPKADFLLLTKVPEGVHSLKLEWHRPGINGRYPPYTVRVEPGKVITVECNAVRYKPTLRVSQPVEAMPIDEWRAFYWPEVYPEKRYIRGKPTSLVEMNLEDALR